MRRRQFIAGVVGAVATSPWVVRAQPVDRVRLFAPPFRNARIEGIKCIEIAQRFGAAQIDRQRKPHAPGTKRFGDAADLRKEAVIENVRVGVDVVDGAAVDANRCQQTGILACAR